MSLSLVDTEFVHFTGKRFSKETLFILRETQGKMGNFILSYWKLWLINPVIVFSYLFFSWRLLFLGKLLWLQRRFDTGSIQFPFARVVLPILILALGVFTSRGGLQRKPLNFVDARIFDAPMMNQLVLNSSFTLIKSAGKVSLPKDQFFKGPEDLKKNILALYKPESQASSFKASSLLPKTTRPNVLFIILESFSLEYMGREGRTSYTPFLDQLAQKSVFYSQAFANGRRSIEGVGALLAGIPAWMEEPFISSEFATNEFVGLGSWLKRRGYSTSFFHGGMNGTMYFDSFAKSAGFDKYYGFNEYPDPSKFDGTWGIFDEPFLQFLAEKLDQENQPFASAVFTLSSHQPYKIPSEYESVFKGGPIEILKSVQYADFALEKFFKTAETKSWYKNTIFVLAADHTGRAYTPQFDHDLGAYQIPILIYSPGAFYKAQEITKPISQMDLLPSLQYLLDPQSANGFAFGENIFSPQQRPVVLYLGDTYMVVDNEAVLLWSRSEGGHLFERKAWPEKKPLEAPELKSKYENYLKAHIELFSKSMYDNKLYFPTGRF